MGSNQSALARVAASSPMHGVDGSHMTDIVSSLVYDTDRH